MQPQQEYGIQETIDLFDLGVALRTGYQASLANDGKFDLKTDYPNFIGAIGIIPRAFGGIKNVPKEWGDLDEKEIGQLRAKFGNIVDDPRFQQLFYGLVLVGDAIVDLTAKKEEEAEDLSGEPTA